MLGTANMGKLKNISVTVTYSVQLGDVDVDSTAYKQLKKVIDLGGEIEGGDHVMPAASEWLADNIREEDAMDWNYEITDLE